MSATQANNSIKSSKSRPSLPPLSKELKRDFASWGFFTDPSSNFGKLSKQSRVYMLAVARTYSVKNLRILMRKRYMELLLNEGSKGHHAPGTIRSYAGSIATALYKDPTRRRQRAIQGIASLPRPPLTETSGESEELNRQSHPRAHRRNKSEPMDNLRPVPPRKVKPVQSRPRRRFKASMASSVSSSQWSDKIEKKISESLSVSISDSSIHGSLNQSPDRENKKESERLVRSDSLAVGEEEISETALPRSKKQYPREEDPFAKDNDLSDDLFSPVMAARSTTTEVTSEEYLKLSLKETATEDFSNDPENRKSSNTGENGSEQNDQEKPLQDVKSIIKNESKDQVD